MEKITKSKIDKLLKNSTDKIQVPYQAGDEEIFVVVNPNIGLADYCAAVAEYAEMMFVNKDDVVVYAPELSVFARAYISLKYFSNIDPDVFGTDRVWALAVNTDIPDRICELTSMNCVISSANEMIKYKNDRIRPAIERIVGGAERILDSIETRLGSFSDEDSENTRLAINKLLSLEDTQIVEALR